MKLIRELHHDVQVLSEATENGKKNLYVEGCFAQWGVPNRNKRVYTESTMKREVGRYCENYVSKKRALGELTHPSSGSPQVNLDRASHLITEMRMEGKNVYGKAKILDTPCGKIVEGLLNGGVQLGVSTRGLGSVKANSDGINEVQDDFQLCTIDIVGDPSGIDCFVDGIMEGVDWISNNGIWTPKQVEEAKQEIVIAKSVNLKEAKYNAFIKLLGSL